MAVTAHPTAVWVAQQLRNAFPEDQAPRYLVHDRDGAFAGVATTLAGMHVDAVRTAPRSPWQNGHVERLIGSIRRECLNHVIVFNEVGLRRVLASYVTYYMRSPYASWAGERKPGASRRPIGVDRPDRNDVGSGRPAPPLRSRRRVAVPAKTSVSSLPSSHVRRPTANGASLSLAPVHTLHSRGDSMAARVTMLMPRRPPAALQPMMEADRLFDRDSYFGGRSSGYNFLRFHDNLESPAVRNGVTRRIRRMRGVHLATCVIALLAFSSDTHAQVRIEKNVVYGMVSGTALLMDVHRPATANGLGIVFVNGSAFTSDPRYSARPLKDTGLSWVAPLVAGGYTVFAVNHRTTPVFRYPAPVEDVERAIRFIRHHASEYGIDPTHLGGLGGSSGGYLIAFAAMHPDTADPKDPDDVNRESSRLQAIVVRAAGTDLTQIANSDAADYISLYLQHPLPRLTTATTDPAFRQAAEASPIGYVSADDPPTLLIHGDNDPTVPFTQSVLFSAALTKAGVPTRLLTIPGGVHGPDFGLKAGVAAPNYLAETVTWFDTYLKPARSSNE